MRNDYRLYFFIFIPMCKTVWHFLTRASAFVVIFALPFRHTHAWTWARSHTLCSLGFKLTLSLLRGAVRRGTNRRPQRSAQAAAMWSVETVGSQGGEALHIHNTFLSHPRGDRKRKKLAINHEIFSYPSISLCRCPGSARRCHVCDGCVVFVIGLCVFLVVYEDD